MFLVYLNCPGCPSVALGGLPGPECPSEKLSGSGWTEGAMGDFGGAAPLRDHSLESGACPFVTPRRALPDWVAMSRVGGGGGRPVTWL